MSIKETKVILHFLKRYQAILHLEKHPELGSFFLAYFSREEIIAILESTLDKEEVEKYLAENLSKEKLFELIDDDYFILRYIINKLETSLTTTPKLCSEEVRYILEELPIGGHYLKDKAVQDWDGYDRSNYFSLLAKHGKTKRVFAIFTSDVKEEEVYAVTTKPAFFFDTKEEAEAEINNIIAEGKCTREDLVAHSLWLFT